MDCKVFTEKIHQFILGDLSIEEKTEMERHIKECDECRVLYNRELEIEKSLRSFFKGEEKIVGEEFKKGILARIDNNRYNRQKKNKNINISKYMKILTPIAAGFFIFIISIKGSFMMGSGNITEEAGDASANSSIMEEHNIEKNEIGVDGGYADDLEEADENYESIALNFTMSRLTKEEFYQLLIEYGGEGEQSTFENSPGKVYSAALLYKNNKILINSEENGEKFILEVQFKDKFSIIKNIEWYNEESLLIVSRNVEEGGESVTLLNIINNNITKVYEVQDNKNLITDVHYTSDNCIIISIKVYDEEDTEKFHNEDIKIYNIEN